MYGIGGEYHLVRCMDCGLAYVNPRPNRDSLKLFYPETYLIEGEDLAPARIDPQKETAVRALMGSTGGPGVARKLANLSSYLRLKRDYRLHVLMLSGRRGRLLDVGCGNGRFIAQMKLLGWDAAGVEINDYTIRPKADDERLKIYVRDFGDVEVHESYDTITMWWFLEHTRDPLGVLIKASSLLAAGGNLVVAVQNFDCIERRIFGKDWSSLDLPRHLYNFTPATMEAMFDRAGFAVVKRINKGFPAWSRETWSFYKESSGRAKDINKLEMRLIRAFSFVSEIVNSSSGMIYILKKSAAKDE